MNRGLAMILNQPKSTSESSGGFIARKTLRALGATNRRKSRVFSLELTRLTSSGFGLSLSSPFQSGGVHTSRVIRPLISGKLGRKMPAKRSEEHTSELQSLR